MKSVAEIISTLPEPGKMLPARSGLLAGAARPAAETPQVRLQAKAREFVGLTFFAPLLQQASDPVLKGKYGHGGRGERVFRGQLNELLAMRIGRSSRLGLADALVKRLSVGDAAAAKELDLKA